ncbi:hypothetical protein HAZT_HAZT003739 [Hyalella azteca]|uniref:MYND-type domain-containing protein n=1 Tax=Hyalella azteca TaxID=294128 RepID=A0A6A0GXX3_HYAAZ|nr:hypothetical protein HAZT_HAZT003739 [Hyalella azteca]
METVEAPYRIDVTAEAGRSLVSTRNLPPGYLLLQEGPAVLGPTALSEPVCLACHSPTSLLFRCPGCQWPMCSQTCADHPTHADECSVLAQDTKGVGIPVNTDATPRYDLILILRFLLLRKKDPDMWEKLMALESHWQKRKAENEPHHSAAVQYFLKVCPMEHEENILHRVRGVIMTNCISRISLLHLGAVSLQLAMLDCNVGRISRPVMLRQLAACRGTLDEARAILRLEPPDTTEEKWIMMEEKERRRLDEIMEQTQELIDEEYGTAQMRRSEEDNLSLEIGDFEDTSVKKVDEYEESCTR